MSDNTETQEWLDELVDRWTEVYKKSMTTLVLLRVVRDSEPSSAATIVPDFVAATGWSVTERGMYRTIRRVASSGLLSVNEVPAARTGVNRKEYQVTPLGHDFLRRIEAQAIATGPSG